MPLYTYACASCGRNFDAFVHNANDPTRDVCTCACGGSGKRRTVYAIRKLGPETHELEAHEAALFSRRELRGTPERPGARLRGPEDLAAKQVEMGVRPLDPRSVEARRERDIAHDITVTESRVAREGGEDAVMAMRTKEEVQGATGWDSNQYARWDAANSAAWDALARGSVPDEALVPVSPPTGGVSPERSG